MPVNMNPWLKRLYEEGYLSQHDYFRALYTEGLIQEDLNTKPTPKEYTMTTRVSEPMSNISNQQKSIWASVAFKESCAEIRNRGENVRPTKEDIAEAATRYYNGLMRFHAEIGLITLVEPEPVEPRLAWKD